jgi:hypothetical protein
MVAAIPNVKGPRRVRRFRGVAGLLVCVLGWGIRAPVLGQDGTGPLISLKIAYRVDQKRSPPEVTERALAAALNGMAGPFLKPDSLVLDPALFGVIAAR